MVSAANELASKAGVEIMQKGGNAIDAAVDVYKRQADDGR